MRVPLLVTDFLRRAAKLYPDKLAVVDGARRFTYRELQARAFRLANALRGLGIGQGDRVCILSPNSHFFLESFYGTSLIGAMLVPLNYRLIAADHEYILNHAGVQRACWSTASTPASSTRSGPRLRDRRALDQRRATSGDARRPAGSTGMRWIGAAERRAAAAGRASTRTTWCRSTTPPAPPRARRASC